MGENQRITEISPFPPTKAIDYANGLLIAETDALQCRYLRFLVAVEIRWVRAKGLAFLLFPPSGHGEVALGSCLMGSRDGSFALSIKEVAPFSKEAGKRPEVERVLREPI